MFNNLPRLPTRRRGEGGREGDGWRGLKRNIRGRRRGMRWSDMWEGKGSGGKSSKLRREEGKIGGSKGTGRGEEDAAGRRPGGERRGEESRALDGWMNGWMDNLTRHINNLPREGGDRTEANNPGGKHTK